MAHNRSFSKSSFLFLSSIFLLILVGQVILHWQLGEQRTKGAEVEVASRQRMLVQEISKLTLDISGRKTESRNYKEQLQDLRKAKQKWVDSHVALTQGNDAYGISPIKSAEAQSIIRDLNPTFVKLKKELDAVLSDPERNFDEHVANILALDDPYDNAVKRLSHQVAQENRKKFDQLYAWSWIFALMTVVVLILAFLPRLLIFRIWSTAC